MFHAYLGFNKNPANAGWMGGWRDGGKMDEWKDEKRGKERQAVVNLLRIRKIYFSLISL